MGSLALVPGTELVQVVLVSQLLTAFLRHLPVFEECPKVEVNGVLLKSQRCWLGIDPSLAGVEVLHGVTSYWFPFLILVAIRRCRRVSILP